MVILFTQWRFFLRNGSFTKEESSNSFCAIAKCLIFSHILFAQWVHIFCMSVLFPNQTKIWFCQLKQHQRKHKGVWPSQCVACGKDWKDFKSFSENSICAMSNRHVCKAWFAMFTSKNDFRYQGKVSKHFVSYAGAEPFQLATCEKAKQNFQKILFAQRVIWY